MGPGRTIPGTALGVALLLAAAGSAAAQGISNQTTVPGTADQGGGGDRPPVTAGAGTPGDVTTGTSGGELKPPPQGQPTDDAEAEAEAGLGRVDPAESDADPVAAACAALATDTLRRRCLAGMHRPD
jgi:hypothetical protein